MKRYFFIGIGVILALAVALVAYGTWLNVSDEKQIARRMDERALSLSGARAEKRALRPKAEMDAVFEGFKSYGQPAGGENSSGKYVKNSAEA